MTGTCRRKAPWSPALRDPRSESRWQAAVNGDGNLYRREPGPFLWKRTPAERTSAPSCPREREDSAHHSDDVPNLVGNEFGVGERQARREAAVGKSRGRVAGTQLLRCLR